MSVEAITWALAQPIKQSSMKFVLVVLANCADSCDFLAWPSIAYLAEATGQDRKTVIQNIERLREAGYLQDSGERKGSTKQVIVYRLTAPEEESQKRNSTENGTVPKFPANSTVFPGKESRFSVETVPKTGHGTVKEPSLEPSVKKTKEAPAEFVMPDWIPADAWTGFVEMRAKKKKEMTPRARDLILRTLKTLQDGGHDIAAILDKSTVNNWTDVYAPKQDERRQPVQPYQTRQDKAKAWADRVTGNHRHDNANAQIIDLN